MILLSFDLEEFDLPFEYGQTLSFDQQIAVSVEGTQKILDVLQEKGVKATFFCTASFAVNARHLIDLIVKNGHEIASHGYNHSSYKDSDLRDSKMILEEMTGVEVKGFRMPRMAPVSSGVLSDAGYLYNSSLNPTCIPGRYNHFGKPRTYHMDGQIIQIPAAVTPFLRIPLFWLSFHNFPQSLYAYLLGRCVKNDGYAAIYFHPWEFVDVSELAKLPFIIRNNSGDSLLERLDNLIAYCKGKDYEFVTYTSFCENI